jgi:hypothetical protein
MRMMRRSRMNGRIINIRDYNKPEELKKYAGSAHGICFTGMSASFKSADSDVIIVAASVDDLNAYWLKLFGRELGSDPKFIEQVAVFRYRDMRGKRLWK